MVGPLYIPRPTQMVTWIILAATFAMFLLAAYLLHRVNESLKLRHKRTRRVWTHEDLDQYTTLVKMGSLSRNNKRGY